MPPFKTVQSLIIQMLEPSLISQKGKLKMPDYERIKGGEPPKKKTAKKKAAPKKAAKKAAKK